MNKRGGRALAVPRDRCRRATADSIPDEIMQILPHRYPFLMVDRIIGFEGETKCIGLKSVTINEPFFQGHFPGHPVMPGVMQVEAMAQVASLLLFKLAKASRPNRLFHERRRGQIPETGFPWRHNVHSCRANETSRANGWRKAKCHCVVNDAVVSEGELMFTFLDR